MIWVTRILARTSQPNVRRNALLWKKNGIAAAFRAASRRDPLAAYLDLEDARSKIEYWRNDYNMFRPHGAIGDLTPSEFLLSCLEASG